ncbi:MAG TPA: DUF1028 domain-containing protein [Solirubrobacteraceae bacterium]|nr:DUF1028 domain-containing protein [Solirubrobacteraceae bacterium]
MTLSLIAADAAAGELGIVIASSSPAVAARCAHIRPRVGVAASQNVTDPRLGPALLDALAAGRDPQAALEEVRAAAAHADYRQLTVIDPRGAGAAWSGARTLGVHGQRIGTGCVAAGNLLASEEVLDALVSGFETTSGEPLTDRLLAALRAGARAGGEAGPLRSAGLLVSAEVDWPIVDLRVDDADAPVGELERLWALYAPLRDDYVTRALRPDAAPAFGVPGDEDR